MRRVINPVLTVLALGALAVAALAAMGIVHPPAPPIAFGAAAALFGVAPAMRSLPKRAKRPVAFLVTLVALVALVAGLAYFQFVIKPTMVKGFMAAAFTPKPTAVSVEPVKSELWPPQLTAIGTLRAYQGVIIAPQAAGNITALHFESGGDVKQGDLLISIDDSVEQADLLSGLAQLKNAEATLARQKTLVAGGNTPQSNLDSALAARGLRRRLGRADARSDRAKVDPRALLGPPRPAQRRSRPVRVGRHGARDPAAARPDLRRLPRAGGGARAPGRRAGRRHDGRRHPGRRFEGKVKAIDARVSAESRNVTVRAEFDNPDRRLLPGMFANLTVTTGAPAEVLTLPRTAIVYSLYGDNVYVVGPAKPAEGKKDADGLAVERRFVKLGPVRGRTDRGHRRRQGGRAGRNAGQVKLQPNAPVTIVETPALPPAGPDAAAVTQRR